jgi:hypothetical protein
MSNMSESVEVATTTSVPVRRRTGQVLLLVVGVLVGSVVVGASTWGAELRALGLQPVGPLVAIALVVVSLFGELPAWVSWLTRVAGWLYPGIALGTVLLLVPWLLPAPGHETSLLAFSPRVWAAYISIVLVGVSFEASDLPSRLYRLCRSLRVGPAVVVPVYVALAGLAGNILDGVSIVAISVIIFLGLLPRLWAVRASFALLFGGLISNLITVAAEPTNIKFQDVLRGLLDGVHPSYWLTNWPISILGILVPVVFLAGWMRREQVTWRERDLGGSAIAFSGRSLRGALPVVLSVLALLLLAGGIVAHAVLMARGVPAGIFGTEWPLWLLLLPAGVLALLHLRSVRNLGAAGKHVRQEWSVWGKLMVIFSLLWLLANGLTEPTNALAVFFTWPEQVRYSLMVLLALASSITDNVALAAMQGALITAHPIVVWQIRLLFILLTWSGGFTPFGCLQSLALNGRLRLSTGAWLRETRVWAALSLAGGLTGLVLIALLYPATMGLPR